MNIIELNKILKKNRGVVLYFYNNHCAPCKVLRPKVQSLIETEFPELVFCLIDTEASSALSAEYQVFASPTILLFIEELEYLRESKNVSISELHDKVDRLYKMAF